jgi:TrmH family RNA methyltransferase
VLAGMSLTILLTQLKMNGIHTLASCVQDATKVGASLSPWEVDWRQPIALLVGNEGAGLPEDIVRGTDARVHIPMARGVESLNAAAAVAVLFYEGYRQREKKK